jgi:phosphoglycerate kinase
MVKFITPAIAKRYRGETCLLRVDLNVEPGAEEVTNRVDAIIPTVQLLLKHNIRVVLLSHRGRLVRRTLAFSLKPFATIIAKKVKVPVRFVPGTNFSGMRARIGSAKGRVLIVENLRFFAGEEENDASFARHLAALGDFYVNDAFAVSHRKHASVVAITKFLPSYGGLWLKEELTRLGEAMKRPRHPFVVVVGGAKVGDKLRSLRGLLRKIDAVLLGSSAFNERNIPNVPTLVWPDDIKMSGDLALDIGPHTIINYSALLKNARTIVWNGSVGFYEKKGFAEGTRAIWEAILANRRAKIVIGGGETIASLSLLKTHRDYRKAHVFLSTGGGAMLAYLAGEKLPGIEALK